MSFNEPVCLLSVDVEDWFHLVGTGLDYQFRGNPGRVEDWDGYPSRIESNIHWILDTLDSQGSKATFFVLGWIARRSPEIVREIHARGHEIASHGYWHRVIRSQSPEEFRDDVRISLAILEDVTGDRIRGYRASSASITDWAIDILGEESLAYDSSFFPVPYHDVYGKLTGMDPRLPIERLRNGLIEVKFSTLPVAGRMLPWSGGGYFRLLPYRVFRRGAEKILAAHKIFQFYIHPWELDEGGPRLSNLKPVYHFRRYVSISKTRGRFINLLRDFRFVPIAQGLRDVGVIEGPKPAPSGR
jgi:polysaccharide deacetylase family protein (PEP-CTERM system associated)